MLLLECHGKELIRAHGLTTPDGVFVARDESVDGVIATPGPWVVKAQIQSGGRGKAGGVIKASSIDEVKQAVERLGSFEMNGQHCLGALIENRISFVSEAYFSLSIDPIDLGVHVLMSAEGGVEIELNDGRLLRARCELNDRAIFETTLNLASQLPQPTRRAMIGALPGLVSLFLKTESLLLEINPFFVIADGSAVIGDVRLSIDENALERQPEIKAIIDNNPRLYPEAFFKARCGFDYVELDHNGEIGLLTTGAGLSMILVDDMRKIGVRPINFCDVRSGLLRGSPQRLIDALTQMASCPGLKAVFVSIFAGVTDLAEFAGLLIQAKRAMPDIQVPFIARLVGNNLELAKQIIARDAPEIIIEAELEKALLILREAVHAH